MKVLNASFWPGGVQCRTRRGPTNKDDSRRHGAPAEDKNNSSDASGNDSNPDNLSEI